jgi:CubicO group peptidase (beta-lactamase class C family)
MGRRIQLSGIFVFALIAGARAAGAYDYAVPDKVADGWDVAALAGTGIAVAPVADMFERIERGEYANIRSVLIARAGKLVVEEYFPRQAGDARERAFRRVAPVETTSATKSVTALLVGIAIDRGQIAGVEEPAATLLPEDAAALPAELRDALQLQHLLAMSAGLSWDEWTRPYADPLNDHVQMLRNPAPLRYVFSRPAVAAPGETFAYNSGLSIALGEIIRHASGMRTDKFAEKFLFGPLGVTDFYWAKYPDELLQTGGGLFLRPRDMLKLGQLMLDGGRWQGQQIVSESWIRACTTNHAPAGAIPAAARADGYGYQWWLSTLKTADAEIASYTARGRGGQFILVIPRAELVAVFTSPADNPLTFQPLDLIERHVLPAVDLGPSPE